MILLKRLRCPSLPHSRALLSGATILMIFAAMGLSSAAAWAQQQGKAPTTMPARERTALVTKDGVQIACDFYPGGFQLMGDQIRPIDGKLVPPIILVHGPEGRGSDFDGFAQGLQNYGFAVAVPDLRGHGQSLTARTAGGNVTLDPERLRPADYAAMVWDIEAVKKFLLDKNNAGELNIELLGVVGADAGALVALNWAVHDWSWPQLPAYKQGQDVKALVLLSPPASYKGLNYRTALKHPVVRSKLAVMIAVGQQDTTYAKEAQRLFTFFERSHAMPEQSLKYAEANTSLRGAKLLRAPGLTLNYDIAVFLHQQLAQRAAEMPWTLRENPLGN